MLLRYLTILPIDLNKISNGDFFEFTHGKRKKRSDSNFDKIEKERERLAETMFTVI